MATFDRADTRAKIITTIAQELKVDKNSITDASTLESLGADSLDIVQIVMQLEEQFDIEINDNDAEHLQTLNGIIDYVHTRRTR